MLFNLNFDKQKNGRRQKQKESNGIEQKIETGLSVDRYPGIPMATLNINALNMLIRIKGYA